MMIKHLQMGMPVGLLKAKLTMDTIIKPAAQKAITSARVNNMAESLAHLEKGFSTNPIMMAETLSESISKLTTHRKNIFFTNLKNSQINESFTNILQNIQGKMNEVKGIGRNSIDSSMGKISTMANESGVKLNQLV